MNHLDVLHQIYAECGERKIRATIPSIERSDDRVVVKHRGTVGAERPLRARPDHAKHHISDSLTTLSTAKQVSRRHTAFGKTSEVHMDGLFEQGEVTAELLGHAEGSARVADRIRLTELKRGTI
jgi:hypothetical protein